jgi:hypothetical protein
LDVSLLYPLAVLIAIMLFLSSTMVSSMLPALAGLLLLGWNSWKTLINLLNRGALVDARFCLCALAGIGLAVLFERLWHGRSERVFKTEALARYLSVMQVAAITALSVFLIHVAPWTEQKYETVGITAAAVVLLGLGILFRSALYRRFGLAVFLYAIGRVFVIDLGHLERFYRIIAFLVLGATLVVVSYLYNRLSERFRKWL